MTEIITEEPTAPHSTEMTTKMTSQMTSEMIDDVTNPMTTDLTTSTDGRCMDLPCHGELISICLEATVDEKQRHIG